MCGVVGIFGKEDANVVQSLYDSLIALQHRGQDAAGIVTYDQHFHLYKGLGLVSHVFQEDDIQHLTGNTGLGHVRYSTAGDGTANDAQPFIVNNPFPIAMAHNGNVTNVEELKKELAEKDERPVSSGCDVEVILNVFASELSKQKTGSFVDKVFQAVNKVYDRVHGSYSVVAFIDGYGLLAFRDPYGIKPLVLGKKDDEYIVASENVMFSLLGFENLKDIAPGEGVFIDEKRKVHRKVIKTDGYCPCIFEYIYFARPDALINDISVYKSRLRMGNKLSERLKPLLKELEVDVVVPVPSTSSTAALTLAYDLGIKYREGLIKNHFIGRTFIMPSNEIIKRALLKKFSPVDLEVRDKNVLLLDDSIVRGNTSLEIIKMLRKAGAKKVYFIVASPPIKFPCVYGIDMPTKQELIGHSKETIEGIRKEIGADFLMYQDLKDLIDSVQEGNPKIKNFCTACFSGKYPTNISAEKLLKLEKDRLVFRKKPKKQMKIFK